MSFFHIRAEMKDNVLMFEERWSNEDDLAQHLRSEKYHDLLLVIEMALKQPEVRFNTVSSFTGIETIEQARGSLEESCDSGTIRNT